MQKCGFSDFENAQTCQLVKLKTKCSNEPHIRLLFDLLSFSFNQPPSWSASESWRISSLKVNQRALLNQDMNSTSFNSSESQKYVTGKSFDSDFLFFSMIIPKRSWNKPITRSCLAKRIRKTRYAIGATSKFHESLHLVIYCPYWVKNLWNNRMNQPFTVNCLLRESFTSFVNVTRIHWTTCCVLGANAKLQCIYQEKLNSTSVCAKHFWLAVQYFSLTNFPSQALWRWGLYGKPSSK